MLSIGTIGRAGYFTEIASSEYYLQGGERPGEWLVASGKQVKREGEVTKESLENVMAGKTRDGSRRLVRPHPRRQSGWDLTFSAPKSVSVLYALAPRAIRKNILRAHEAAVEKAMQYLLREAIWARRGKGGAEWERVKTVLLASFTHISSRAGDPDVHDHVLLANMGIRQDGTTGSIWSRDIYNHMLAAGAVYRVELAHQLQQRLGLVVYRVRDWFEVKGISQAVCRHFSQRSEEIRRVAREFGERHPRFLELVTKVTRGVKGHLPHQELHAQWKARAAKLGLGLVHIINLINRSQPRMGEKRARRTAYKAASQAIHDLSDRHSYFTERQLVKAATPYVIGKGRGADLLLQATKIATAQLVELRTPGQRYRYFTTMELYNTEIRLMRMAAGYGRQQRGAFVPFSRLLKILDKSKQFAMDSDSLSERNWRLSMERAVRYLVSSKERIRVLSGVQGVGKTTALRLAKLAYAKQGYEVIGCAPTIAATKELRRQLGGDCVTARTLLDAVSPSRQRRLTRLARQSWRLVQGKRVYRKNQQKLDIEQKPGHFYRQLKRMLRLQLPRYAGKIKLTKKTVILIDEAQKLDTRTAHDLVKAAQKHGCTLRFAYTLDAPTGGGPGGAIQNMTKQIGSHVLKATIGREKEAWVGIAHAALREGDGEGFLKLYRKGKSLTELKSQRLAIKAIAKAWVADKTTDTRDKVVMASSQEEVDKLNKAIRKATGHLLGFSRWSVKMPTGDRVCRGDRVRLGKNDRYLGIDAGDMGRVTKIQRYKKNPTRKRMWVKLEERKRFWLFKKKVVIDTRRYKDIRLGYAMLPSQVQTKVANTFVLLNGSRASRESVLHQVTRAEKKTRLFAVKSSLTKEVDLLARTVSKSQQKQFAHDYEIQQQQARQKKQQEQRRSPGHRWAM